MAGVKPIGKIMVGIIKLQICLETIFFICPLVRRIIGIGTEESIFRITIHVLIDVFLIGIIVVGNFQVFTNFTSHDHRRRAGIDLDGLCLVDIHKGKAAHNWTG